MLQSVRDAVLPAIEQRLVLLVNHVVSREDAAMQRLRAHAGRALRLEPFGTPAWLPALPPLTLAVTPAGLFERSAALEDVLDLHLRVDLGRPDRWLAALAAGERPAVSIDGDAAFAADVNWLADNLRWDVEADLAAIVGPVAAHEIGRAARAAAAALKGFIGDRPAAR